MDDREMLELAAKAAGHKLLSTNEYEDQSGLYGVVESGDGYCEDFDPANEDGDAFRLGVKVGAFSHPKFNHYLAMERFGGQECDDCRANRRAVFRVAAEIGKAMP